MKYLRDALLKHKGTNKLKVNGGKKLDQTSMDQKITNMAMISSKIDFRAKNIFREYSFIIHNEK